MYDAFDWFANNISFDNRNGFIDEKNNENFTSNARYSYFK